MTNFFFSFSCRRASRLNPFECKDIKIALHEIRELQNEIENLEMAKADQTRTIQNLLESVERLNRTVMNHGLTTPPPTLYPASLQNRCDKCIAIGKYKK